MSDWFRRQTWTTVDEEEFFAKLGRARKDGRAQYLKIQAMELVSTGNTELLNIAETLLNKILTEYPYDNFNKSSVLNVLGRIYGLRKNFTKAISFYKQSLDFEKIYPNVITASFLDFSELVIQTERKDLYDYTEELLRHKAPNLLFPIEKYKVFSILSIISKENGQIDVAKSYAELAEQSATAETSGLHYHKYLGIVKEREIWLDKLVE